MHSAKVIKLLFIHLLQILGNRVLIRTQTPLIQALWLFWTIMSNTKWTPQRGLLDSSPSTGWSHPFNTVVDFYKNLMNVCGIFFLLWLFFSPWFVLSFQRCQWVQLRKQTQADAAEMIGSEWTRGNTPGINWLAVSRHHSVVMSGSVEMPTLLYTWIYKLPYEYDKCHLCGNTDKQGHKRAGILTSPGSGLTSSFIWTNESIWICPKRGRHHRRIGAAPKFGIL